MPDLPDPGKLLADRESLERMMRRMALSMVEQIGPDLALVGIRRGGVAPAHAMARILSEDRTRPVSVGTVDIALYRDDAATQLPDPKIGPSDIRFAVDGRDVVVIDDVLQTGRTVRAAIDCLLDYGRPRRIWLAVLFDRRGRELPVAPDFCGRAVDVPAGTKILVEVDGEGVLLGARRVERAAS